MNDSKAGREDPLAGMEQLELSDFFSIPVTKPDTASASFRKTSDTAINVFYSTGVDVENGKHAPTEYMVTWFFADGKKVVEYPDGKPVTLYAKVEVSSYLDDFSSGIPRQKAFDLLKSEILSQAKPFNLSDSDFSFESFPIYFDVVCMDTTVWVDTKDGDKPFPALHASVSIPKNYLSRTALYICSEIIDTRPDAIQVDQKSITLCADVLTEGKPKATLKKQLFSDIVDLAKSIGIPKEQLIK